jgi:hypothetical protein
MNPGRHLAAITVAIVAAIASDIVINAVIMRSAFTDASGF